MTLVLTAGTKRNTEMGADNICMRACSIASKKPERSMSNLIVKVVNAEYEDEEDQEAAEKYPSAIY